MANDRTSFETDSEFWAIVDAMSQLPASAEEPAADVVTPLLHVQRIADAAARMWALPLLAC
jgi:hypothetical protein